MTTFEYDGERLVRSITVREPEFDAAERAVLLASRRLQHETNRFGVPIAEAMDPKNQFKFQGFEAPKVDWSEKAVEDAKDRFYKAWPDANRNGHRWGIKSS